MALYCSRMAIDSTIHALIEHFHELCPNLTVSGTNTEITIRYVGLVKALDRYGYGSSVPTLLTLKFDGSFLRVSKPAMMDKYNIPPAFDLNSEKDLKQLEEILTMISDKCSGD